MRYRKKTLDEICDTLDAMREVDIHDMANAELWKIVTAISEAHRNLGDAVRDWFSEITKTILGEIPYDMPVGNGQFPSDGLLDGLLADPAGAFRAIMYNLAHSISKTREFKRILTNSGLTLQERTVVVLHYIHGKSELELGVITGYTNAAGTLWTAIVKIGHMLRNAK